MELLSLPDRQQRKNIFKDLISGPSLMDSTYDKYNYANKHLQNILNNII
jgi:hypothetical protein